MSRTVWMRRSDWIPVALCFAAAVGMAVWGWTSAAGQTLRVTTPTQELVFPMAQNGEFPVEGKDGHVLLVCIEDGAAFVKEADCPDLVCVQTGRLTRSGQTAACLPAGVLLTVEGDSKAPDAVAR